MMSCELHLRQKAIRLRQAGGSVSWICRQLHRSRDWFYKWWGRYLDDGAAGLRERSRTPRTARRICSPEMRQAILDIRDRLMRRHGPRERYRLAGAPTIRHELECLGYEELPSLRTIERVLQEAGRTSPAFRPRPSTTSHDYPARPATRSNQLHQLDLIGPRYLKGSRRQWFFLVYRDVYDHAIYVEFQPKPKMESILDFVVRAWQRLGLPDRVQVDNSELFGLTSHPGALSRFVRLALWVGVELTFIPEHEPWRNGAIESFNGWLQERVLSIPLHSPTQVRREVAALMSTCWTEHLHPHLNFQTTAHVRRGLSRRTLPHTFKGHRQPLPVAIGRVVFIRRVRPSGRITILGIKFKVGKRLAHHYVLARLYTRTMTLKVYSQGHLLKQFGFPFVGKLKL
jgi:hypothetical protein